ncbi:MAG TPA: IclR family transcriptional regulator C-terminal domain-containing protein [Burkholderiaceae bacterium]
MPEPTDPSAPPPPPAAPAVAAGAVRPGDAFVQSFARGLAVLRSFGAEAPAQTLSAAAARSGMTRAGARRILLTLQQLGYVEAEGRLFRLTPRVLELGFAYLSSQPVWHLAQPVMEELVQDIHESSSAAVLDGADIVYVLRVPARKIITTSLGPGSRLPAYCTAMGRVLLAGLPPAQRRERLEHAPRPARTARTLTDVDALLGAIEQVHRDGYALVHGELEEGLVAMAAPVVNRAGRVVAAINVSAPDQRMPPDEMRKRLLPRLLESAASVNTLMRMQD